MDAIEEAKDAGEASEVTPIRKITPHLPAAVMRKLSAFIETKLEIEPSNLPGALRRLHQLWQHESGTWALQLRAVALLIADLLEQGWAVEAIEEAIYLQPPGLRLEGETLEQAKDRLRRALQVGRDRQLEDPGVQKFIKRMHRSVPRVHGPSSIADVIEQGPELAEQLRAIADKPADTRADALRAIVDPVIEVCDEGAKCSVTGLRLIDIWRYFRHTWSLEYRSTPGRQLALLVRNAARPKRPVIGIAMLASPVVRTRVRDDWIGWNQEPFLAKLQSGEWDSKKALRSLFARIEQAIADIRTDDLVSTDELAVPNERTILRLEQRGAGAALARQRELQDAFSQAEDANEQVRSQREPDLAGYDADWHAASAENLFVRKRADTLGKLLDAKRTFQSLDWRRSTGEQLLGSLLQHPNGLRTVSTALQEVRKAGLSSQVADVSVCGAVAPYNTLLGGKLVALLMASAEVRDFYRTRYGEQVSIISSQMAGRPISRPADLKVLTTTSLYGNGASQYNRLRLRARDYAELKQDIEWRELAKTAGYGTVHLGATTVQVLREFSEQTHGARRVNYLFGEGSSPRLRQIREAVEDLGIDSEAILHHATPRLFFGCELHPGAIEELVGLRRATPGRAPSAKALSASWRKRWLVNRIAQEDFLDRVAQIGPHTFQEDLVRGADDVNSSEVRDEEMPQLRLVSSQDY